MSTKLQTLPCKIERGSFSGERSFTIKLSSGEDYKSLAHFSYFSRPDRTPITKSEPELGQVIEGYVEAVLVARQDEIMDFEVPDGELVSVSKKQLPVAKR